MIRAGRRLDRRLISVELSSIRPAALFASRDQASALADHDSNSVSDANAQRGIIMPE